MRAAVVIIIIAACALGRPSLGMAYSAVHEHFRERLCRIVALKLYLLLASITYSKKLNDIK